MERFVLENISVFLNCSPQFHTPLEYAPGRWVAHESLFAYQKLPVMLAVSDFFESTVGYKQNLEGCRLLWSLNSPI